MDYIQLYYGLNVYSSTHTQTREETTLSAMYMYKHGKLNVLYSTCMYVRTIIYI